MVTPTILVRSMGKIFPARAFADDEAANRFCEKHDQWGVIAVQADGIVYCAHLYPLKTVGTGLLDALVKDIDELAA